MSSHAGRVTLAQFLAQPPRRSDAATDELDALILSVSQACAAIARRVAHGALLDGHGATGTHNGQGEAQQKLDVVSHELFLRAHERSGLVAGLASEELDDIHPLPTGAARGGYLLTFDPLDGSSNVDVNVAVGSIFSIVRAAVPGRDAAREDFLQPGTAQVCAGYAIYGPCAMLVVTLGNGTHGFTLDPQGGEWVLSHARLSIPAQTREFAINASNHRHWEPAVRRYVDECVAGASGPRGEDFNMRWIASLVAETHRILMRGGVFLYPRDARATGASGRLRVLYETHPIAFLIEQAGGMASTGCARAMSLRPDSLHERTGFVFGSSEEVLRIERYHGEAGSAGMHSASA